MGRPKNRLAKRDSLLRTLEMLIIVADSPQGQIPAKQLFKRLPELGEGYVGTKDTYKLLDRTIESAVTAGFGIRREPFMSDSSTVSITSLPFLALDIHGDDLAATSALAADLKPRVDESSSIPEGVLQARAAREAGRFVVVEKSAEVHILVLHSEVIYEGKWFLLGHDSAANPRTIRIFDDTQVTIGDLHDWDGRSDFAIERMFEPLVWNDGDTELIGVEIPGKVRRGSQLAFGAQLFGETEEDFSAGTWIDVSVSNRTEFYRTLLKMRENVGVIDDFEEREQFLAYWNQLIDTPPISKGYEDIPPMPLPDPANPNGIQTQSPASNTDATSDQVFPLTDLPRISGGASVTSLLMRLLFAIHYLGATARLSELDLAERLGMEPAQVATLIATWNEAISKSSTRPDLQITRTSDDEGQAVYLRVDSHQLLQIVGRYDVSMGGLLALACAAFYRTEEDAELRRIVNGFVGSVSDTLNTHIYPSSSSSIAQAETLATIEATLDGTLEVEYTDPWTSETAMRTIYPLTKPREVAGKWMFHAATAEAKDQAVEFQVSSMRIVSSEPPQRGVVPHHFSQDDIQQIERRLPKTVVVRAEEPSDWVYLERYLNAELRKPFEPESDARTYLLRMPEPIDERLFDLFVDTDGRVQAEFPIERRGEPQARLREMRDASFPDGNWDWG